MVQLTKEKRDKIISVGIGTIIVIAGLWFGLIGPQKIRLDARYSELMDLRTKVDKAERMLKKADEYQNGHLTIQDKLKAKEIKMAQGDFYRWFMGNLQAFINRKGHHLVYLPEVASLELHEVRVIPEFPYRAASFNVRGTSFYHDFGKFLADFENENPFMQVRDLNLVPGSLGISEGALANRETLLVEMKVVALVRPLESE